MPQEVDAPAPAAAEKESGPAYDESALIIVKGRVVKPQKPDDSERNVAVAKLQEEITKRSERIKEIKEMMDSRSGKGPPQTGPAAELRQKQQALRAEFSEVLVRLEAVVMDADSRFWCRAWLSGSVGRDGWAAWRLPHTTDACARGTAPRQRPQRLRSR